jgi:type IX secretion system PorP/SprF family membrane protein
MKNITTILFLFGFALLHGQQQPHNTQFMYYKLGYNPAYAGSQETGCLTCIYRQQWLGLDGAPSMAVATFNMPLANQRVGVGANLYRHTIGITTVYNLDLAYSYRVRLGNGMLGLGIMGSIRSMQQDFGKTVATQDKDLDQSIPGDVSSKLLFNFGAGAYYASEKFYLGLSAPRFLENNIDFADDDVSISREVQHGYLMAGMLIPVNEDLTVQPQGLLKLAAKAPVDFDANVTLHVQKRYFAGLTYRFGGNELNSTGESLDLLVGGQVSSNLMLGISYDLTLSDIRDYSTGSIEASVRYCMGKASSEDKEFINPRFF